MEQMENMEADRNQRKICRFLFESSDQVLRDSSPWAQRPTVIGIGELGPIFTVFGLLDCVSDDG